MPVAATSNSIAPPEPQRISIDSISSSAVLLPGAACTVPIILSPAEVGPLDVCVVALFREVSSPEFKVCLGLMSSQDEAATFYSRRSSRAFHVHNLVEAALVASPRPNADGSFVVDIEVPCPFTRTVLPLTRCISSRLAGQQIWRFNRDHRHF